MTDLGREILRAERQAAEWRAFLTVAYRDGLTAAGTDLLVALVAYEREISELRATVRELISSNKKGAAN